MTDEIAKKLNENIPAEVVKNVNGFDYLSGEYVLNRLNEVFGHGGYSFRVVDLAQMYAVQEGTKTYVGFRCLGELTVPALGVTRQDVGCGFKSYSEGKDPGRSMDGAIKEAVTDCIKRCARTLGPSMGLALYDKDKTKVTRGAGATLDDEATKTRIAELYKAGDSAGAKSFLASLSPDQKAVALKELETLKG